MQEIVTFVVQGNEVYEKVPKTEKWKYKATGDKIKFKYKNKNSVYKFTEEGYFIGKEILVMLDGFNSRVIGVWSDGGFDCSYLTWMDMLKSGVISPPLSG